ncbi:MAG: hypothetical protein KH046_16245 [Stenotrophomonas maltophilia]|uniref:hypothetical protein n=1 Tax=Stenotrophomonas TaxID=40323 RepID=UPI00131003AE|nr:MULTISPECIES: hypothetical protein [Stenotrophomonas]MBS4802374.1 hypothetical protein [Stenotrophomonas maltophilia]MDG9988589.1 hypothetical protein [Stenotrophomonas sp. GD04024]
MRMLLYFLVLTAFPAAGNSDPLSPEAAFDLHARVMLRNDADARREFDARIGPALGPYQGMHPEVPPLARGLSSSSLDLMLQSAAADGVRRHTYPWATAVLRRTHCHATGSKVWQRSGDGYHVADIRFTCQVADVQNLHDWYIATLFDQRHGKDRFWSAYMKQLLEGPLRTTEGTTQLVAASDDGIWHSERLGGTFPVIEQNVAEALWATWLPMKQWQAEAKQRMAQHLTRNTECDSLLRRYWTCSARLGPRDLSGADALAAMLVDSQHNMPEAERSQQCTALRSKIEALWPEPCE